MAADSRGGTHPVMKVNAKAAIIAIAAMPMNAKNTRRGSGLGVEGVTAIRWVWSMLFNSLLARHGSAADGNSGRSVQPGGTKQRKHWAHDVEERLRKARVRSHARLAAAWLNACARSGSKNQCPVPG